MIHEVDRSTMAPCPFCGQQGDYYINDISTYHFHIDSGFMEPEEYQYSVECAKCNATYYGDPVDTQQEAYDNVILGWNTRV